MSLCIRCERPNRDGEDRCHCGSVAFAPKPLAFWPIRFAEDEPRRFLFASLPDAPEPSVIDRLTAKDRPTKGPKVRTANILRAL